MDPDIERMLESHRYTIGERLPYHLSSPTVSLEEYHREQTLAVGELMAAKRKIYLDANYWINMRMAIPRKDGIYFELYSCISDLGSCPLAELTD
jgi:hypothetical protein